MLTLLIPNISYI